MSTAKHQLDNFSPAQSPQDRIAVILLSASARQTECFLEDYNANVAPYTPSDIFVFSHDNTVGQALRHYTSSSSSRLVFLPLKEHWQTPEEAEDPSLWSAASHFNAEYRQMGHWRLTFQMEFAARLGYKYVLQVDDDSAFQAPVDMNFLETMQVHNLWLGARLIVPQDHVLVTTGAAEIAKLFLVMEGFEPTILFTDDCSPQNISGLYTRGLGGPNDGGYSTRHINGNFVLISVDFWFQRIVQRFLRLVLRTGAHFRMRWNEQQTTALMWQMFVPPDKFMQLNFPYSHPVKCTGIGHI